MQVDATGWVIGDDPIELLTDGHGVYVRTGDRVHRVELVLASPPVSPGAAAPAPAPAPASGETDLGAALRHRLLFVDGSRLRVSVRARAFVRPRPGLPPHYYRASDFWTDADLREVSRRLELERPTYPVVTDGRCCWSLVKGGWCRVHLVPANSDLRVYGGRVPQGLREVALMVQGITNTGRLRLQPGVRALVIDEDEEPGDPGDDRLVPLDPSVEDAWRKVVPAGFLADRWLISRRYCKTLAEIEGRDAARSSPSPWRRVFVGFSALWGWVDGVFGRVAVVKADTKYTDPASAIEMGALPSVGYSWDHRLVQVPEAVQVRSVTRPAGTSRDLTYVTLPDRVGRIIDSDPERLLLLVHQTDRAPELVVPLAKPMASQDGNVLCLEERYAAQLRAWLDSVAEPVAKPGARVLVDQLVQAMQEASAQEASAQEAEVRVTEGASGRAMALPTSTVRVARRGDHLCLVMRDGREVMAPYDAASNVVVEDSYLPGLEEVGVRPVASITSRKEVEVEKQTGSIRLDADPSVSIQPTGDRWRLIVAVGGNEVMTGTYDSPEEAQRVGDAAVADYVAPVRALSGLAPNPGELDVQGSEQVEELLELLERTSNFLRVTALPSPTIQEADVQAKDAQEADAQGSEVASSDAGALYAAAANAAPGDTKSAEATMAYSTDATSTTTDPTLALLWSAGTRAAGGAAALAAQDAVIELGAQLLAHVGGLAPEVPARRSWWPWARATVAPMAMTAADVLRTERGRRAAGLVGALVLHGVLTHGPGARMAGAELGASAAAAAVEANALLLLRDLAPDPAALIAKAMAAAEGLIAAGRAAQSVSAMLPSAAPASVAEAVEVRAGARAGR